jgi:uncharacterized membrane protein
MARGGRRDARIEGFAEDLGRLLGTAQAKAHGWLGQRQTIVKELEQIRDTAAGLLAELGTMAAGRRRRGRGAKALDATVAGVKRVEKIVARKTRTLSAQARKAISDAQKRRWAKVRAAKEARAKK